MAKQPQSRASFRVIAERRLKLRGPARRDVVVRIGIPEPYKPRKFKTDCRCPFQVVGLSDDSIQYAVGIDSLQALNLAFAGARQQIKRSCDVLAGFHKDLSLTFLKEPWDESFPLWCYAPDRKRLRRLERFIDTLYEASTEGES